MRMREIVREAWRNVVTGAARASLLFFIFAGGLASLVAFDSVVQRDGVRAAITFVKSGAATTILTASGRISGDRCDRLRNLPNVQSSGAFRASNAKLVLRTLPSAGVPTFDVTSGFLEVLGVEPGAGTGVFGSVQLLNEQGRWQHEMLQTTRGPIEVAGAFSYPEDGRRTGLEYSLLIPNPPEHNFDECWVTIWPQTGDVAALLYSTLDSSEGAKEEVPQVGQLNTTHGANFDRDAAFASRVTKPMAPVGAAMGVAIGLAGVSLRRLSLVSARRLGVTRDSQSRIMLLECAFWALPAAAPSVAILVGFIADLPGGDAIAIFWETARIPVCGLLGLIIGVHTGTASIRRSNLLRYFENR